MNITVTVDKLRAAARKDPKKAGVLVLLVAVMGGMWTKVLVRPTPASAGAAAPPAPAGPAAPPSDKPRTTPVARQSWSTVPLAPAARNLFRVEYERYEQAGKSTAPGAPAQHSGDSPEDPSKSGPSPADLKRERQILVANLQTQAGQLKLQSTVMGARPKAVINGSLVEEGDIVASFRVTRISARGVVVEREGIKFDVAMK
jgi:hypothetical protein